MEQENKPKETFAVPRPVADSRCCGADDVPDLPEVVVGVSYFGTVAGCDHEDGA